jgi:hypothetical protein
MPVAACSGTVCLSGTNTQKEVPDAIAGAENRKDPARTMVNPQPRRSCPVTI